MRKLSLARATALCLALWSIVLSGVSLAQNEAAEPEEDSGAPAEVEAEAAEGGLDLTAGEADDEDFAQIDELLLMDEEVRADPGTYSYDPGARRDPFRSLVRERADNMDLTQRPEGVPGLLIDEIEIEGIFLLEEGPVAQVVSASQRTSFLLRPGDQLWDGEVVDINMQELVFKQSVNDPTALKPFREVVKELNP